MGGASENGATFEPLPADYQALSAEAKRDILWSNVEKSSYDLAGPLPSTDPSAFATMPLVWPPYLSHAFLHTADELEEGRIKVIHTFGSTAKVSLQFASTNGAARYTGIYGANSAGLVRISMARMAGESFTPGAAFKALIDKRPSINLMAMYSLDGQGQDRNLFSHTWTHFVKKPEAFPLKIVGAAFHTSLPLIDLNPAGRRALRLSVTTPVSRMYLGKAAARPLDEEHIPLLEGAQVGPDGLAVTKVAAPLQLLFKPTAKATEIYAKYMSADIRVALAEVPVGTVLWEVFAKDMDTADEERIGQVVTESLFVASKYGDEKLYFQHQRHRTV